MRSTATILLLLLSAPLVFAQQDTTSTQGEIIDAEIVIEKEKVIRFPISEKINTATPGTNFRPAPLKLSYTAMEPKLNWPAYQSEVSYQEVSLDKGTTVFQNFVKAGYGNFASPLLSFGVYQPLGKVKATVEGDYERFGSGPVADENSSSSASSIKASVNYQTDKVGITPQLTFLNRSFNFYGNTNRMNTGFSSELPVAASFEDLAFHLKVGGSTPLLDYEIVPEFFTTDHGENGGNEINKEAGFNFDGDLAVVIDSFLTVDLGIAGFASTYSSGPYEYDRSLFKLTPSLHKSFDDLTLTAAFTVASGEIGDFRKETGFYPQLHARWGFSEFWSVFGSVSSGIDQVNLSDLLMRNEFLDDSLIVLNTRTSLSIKAGLAGQVAPKVRAEASLQHEELDDLPFYLPSATDSTRFTVAYDSSTVTRTTISGALSYVPNADNLVSASINLFSYRTNSLERAWHQPAYEVRIASSHRIDPKVLVGAELLALGGIEAPAQTPEGLVRLDNILDLNVHTTYALADHVSAFVRVNNLLGNEYERFVGYPVRGLTFKLGGVYRF